MKLSEALKIVRPIMPIGPPEALLNEAVKSEVDPNMGLKEAEEQYVQACGRTDHVLSDLSYWLVMGTEIVWETFVNLLRVAEKNGPDDLPDIPSPSLDGQVVMDAQHHLREWGKKIAKEAGIEPIQRPPFKKREGCKCVSCSSEGG